MIFEIKQFFGGISDDVRQQQDGVFFISKHFDIYTNPLQLAPYKDQEPNNTISGTTSTTVNLAFDNLAYSGSNLFAIGRSPTSAGRLKIFEKSEANIPAASWTISATATQTGNGAPIRSSFVPFRDYLWGVKGSSTGTSYKGEVWKYGPLSTGTRVLTESFSSTNSLTTDDATLARAANGFVGKDGNCYLPYENKLAMVSYSGGVFSLASAQITLPVTHTITSCALWGNYVALGCQPVTQWGASSKVFLWNYVDDDVSDVVDWGDGDLIALANIDGYLVGVSSFSGLAPAYSIIKSWNGNSPQIVKRLPYGYTRSDRNTWVPHGVYQNKFLFPLHDSNSNALLFSLSRVNQNYPWAVTADRLLNGTSTVSSVSGLICIGDYLFAIHDAGNVSKTDDGGGRTQTHTLISQKLNGGDLNTQKQLKAVTVMYQSLPASAAVYLDYRADSDASNAQDEAGWTQIFADTAQNSISHEAVNIEATGGPLPIFKEIQFRIRVTGNAKIVGMKGRADELATQIYK